MAFNFNWSPLAADTSFYTRAQDLLTAALNKSPKPPIIVDDILVHELNLGSVPPDLEILEIGDLAEDKFRGIFKMRYSGDAFLTLKTRVQANPLNTYLSTRPLFGSPEPLAAASGLTIPLKITLSEIKLSAFIILVFSKQKGLTLVFRNDPLESLKVSSTFDSISFVRDYLQKEIEGQLRTLLMDEVPAIIHRLSLRLWVPEYREKEDRELAENSGYPAQEETVTDPLASPPQDPVDLNGNVLDATQIASLSLDSTVETHSLFSQKNLLRLAALNDSHRTLSLFSPGMRDVVLRAWAGQMEGGDSTGIHSPIGATLSRKHSHIASTDTTYSFSGAASEAGSHSTRPSMANHASSFGMSSLGKHVKPGRKRKNRVVNLRKPKPVGDDAESISGSDGMSATLSSTASDNGHPAHIPEEREAELITPPPSPRQQRLRGTQNSPDSIDLGPSPPKVSDRTPRQPARDKQRDSAIKPLPTFTPLFEAGPSDHHDFVNNSFNDAQNPLSGHRLHEDLNDSNATIRPVRPKPIRPQPTRFFKSWQPPAESGAAGSFSAGGPSSAHATSPRLAAPFPYAESSPGGILEQAWMMKMAGEIARRVEEQKGAEKDSARFWDGQRREGTPPPAYAN